MSRTIVDIRTEVVSYVTQVYILEDSTGNVSNSRPKLCTRHVEYYGEVSRIILE
jgi:hypothetical protein